MARTATAWHPGSADRRVARHRPTTLGPVNAVIDAVESVIDAVESWLAGQSFWGQIPILLLVLVPICWLLAGVVDRIVELALRRHTRREAALHAQTDPGALDSVAATDRGVQG